MILVKDGALLFRFRDKDLPIELEYHDSVQLDVRVNHEMRIRVKAPLGKSFEAVEERLRAKTGWILRQLIFFENNADFTFKGEIKPGSTIRFLGREYLAELEQGTGPEEVWIDGKFIKIRAKVPTDPVAAYRVLRRWLRSQATRALTPIYDSCFSKIQKYGVEWSPFYLKRMNGRWGSCTPEGAIYLNPDLVMLPPHLIEYAVLHEMCHLISARHDQRFYKHLELIMPDWRDREKEMGAG